MLIHTCLCALVVIVSHAFCEAQSTERATDHIKPEIIDSVASNVPRGTVRIMDQDGNGNIWIAAFDGVFKYDGRSFTNVGGHLTSSRFFSVLADRQGNIWFASMGSGVYKYDGRSFENFTTKEGLINNEVMCIYEDRSGNVWFGAFGGASRYNGKSFRTYRTNGNTMNEDNAGPRVETSSRPSIEVTSIVEDKTGRLWFSTRGDTFIFDGTTFKPFVNQGKSFTNVRCLMADKMGNVWFGTDGLWRYDGSTCTNLTRDHVVYVCEDNDGNIWTSSQKSSSSGWVISRYDAESLYGKNPMVVELASHPIIWSIFQAYNGKIWYGAVGLYCYDGGRNVITHYTSKQGQY